MSLKMPSKAQKAIIERQEGFQENSNKPQSGEDTDKVSTSPKAGEGTEGEGVAPAKKRVKKTRSVSSPPSEVSEPLVPQTFKIPQSLTEKIKIVSVTRKVKKEWPYTQQDIVSEALADWFKKVGE